VWRFITSLVSTIMKKYKLKPIIDKFDACCTPKKNRIIEHWKFNVREKSVNESYDHYLTDLKNLASTCTLYRDLKDELICDRIVLNVKDKQLWTRLFKEGDGLTLDRCIEMCRSDELTKQHLMSLS